MPSIPLFGNIFEKLLQSRLMSFLIQNAVLSKKQLGVISKRSTIDALFEVVERICNLRSKKQVAHCNFLDLSKAFDTVDQKLLIRKCEIFGLRGIASNVLTSNLSDREQFLDFNGKTSSNLGVTCRISQSSVLGPLLFLLYINNLTNLENHGDLVLYTDDTTINVELKTNYLHDDLTAVELWMSQNKLTINQSKT